MLAISFRLVVLLSVALLPKPAWAQSTWSQFPLVTQNTNIGDPWVNPNTDFITAIGRGTSGAATACCVQLPLSYFANTLDIQRLNSRIDEVATATQANTLALQQHALKIAQLQSEFARMSNKLSQSIALSSALTIVPPKEGDRFSLTLSGADFEGHAAGSVSLSYRPEPRVLLFGGIARSEDASLAKGGASFSFK